MLPTAKPWIFAGNAGWVQYEDLDTRKREGCFMKKLRL